MLFSISNSVKTFNYLLLYTTVADTLYDDVFFFHVVGVIAVALTEKKESTTSVRPSHILFYSFSDPCNPQVRKLYERDPLSEYAACTSW